MFCPYCGNKMTENARFCSKCGKPFPKEMIEGNQSPVDAAMRYSDTRPEDGGYMNQFFFKKVKVIQPIPEDAKIWFKHGWDKFFLRVTKEQFGLILKSFEERCAGAVRGEVIKRK